MPTLWPAIGPIADGAMHRAAVGGDRTCELSRGCFKASGHLDAPVAQDQAEAGLFRTGGSRNHLPNRSALDLFAARI